MSYVTALMLKSPAFMLVGAACKALSSQAVVFDLLLHSATAAAHVTLSVNASGMLSSRGPGAT